MCLNYKIYNVLVFSCKTIQIVSANLTYNDENNSPNSTYYINNESEKKGNCKGFSSSKNGQYSSYKNKKGSKSSDIYKDSNIRKGTYSKDCTPGENIKSGSRINNTSLLYDTTYKKESEKKISKQKNETNANNKKNNKSIIEEVENDDEGTIEEGGNYNIIKKLNFDDVDVDDNSKVENCIQEDKNEKLDDKQKKEGNYIIKYTETNGRCCCCQ